MSLIIRSEQPADIGAIRRVNELAFGQPAEAGIVDALREAGSLDLSLVADLDGEVAGHIAFSPVTVDGEQISALGLGPMAVLPEHQRKGIGSALVIAGLDACRRLGAGAVFVLGLPYFYPRFGFIPAHEVGCRCTYDAPPEVFMVYLAPGYSLPSTGLVRYHEVFDTA